MADKKTKFTDEELQDLRDLQTNYQQKVFDFGNLKVEKMLMEKRQLDLEDREESLQEEWEGVQEQEKELVQKLTDKYGPGQLDPTTGVFTPSPEPEATSEVKASAQPPK